MDVFELAAQADLLEALLAGRLPVGIAVFDRDLRLRRCNPTWAEYVERYTPSSANQAVPGARLFDLAPGTEGELAPLLGQVLDGETVRRDDLRLQSGGIVSYRDVVLTPLVEDGRVVGVVDVSVDATERVLACQDMEQRVEARTHEIERRRQVAEGLRDMLATLNSDRTLEEILDYVVGQSSRLLGADACLVYRLEEDGRRMVLEADHGLPPDHKALLAGPTFPTLIARAILDCQPAAIPDLPAYAASQEHAAQLGDFHRRWFKVAGKVYRSALGVPLIVGDALYGGLVFYFRQPREFSEEEFRLGVALGDHAALAIENARLRAQAEQVAVVRERERLARELHDSVTQSLYSMTLLAEAGRQLAGVGDQERVEGYLERLGQIGQQALKEMRLLVYQLRPLLLRREGLVGALQQRLDAVEKRAGVDARLLVEGQVSLPATVEEGLYRIAREALNNTLKHATASSVVVTVRGEDGRVELEVADDGAGFDPGAMAGRGGMGLVGMQERAEKLGASFDVLSTPGEGTRVRVSVEVARG